MLNLGFNTLPKWECRAAVVAAFIPMLLLNMLFMTAKTVVIAAGAPFASAYWTTGDAIRTWKEARYR